MNILIGKETCINRNCVFIGLNAGINITSGDGVVIIGDDIKDLDKSQKNVLFIGDKIAIGKTLMGIDINLKEVIEQLFVKEVKIEE